MSVSRRYARALFEICQANRFTHEQYVNMENSLESVSNALASSRSLRVALQSPVTTLPEKERVVKALIVDSAYPKLCQQFVLLLVKQRRVNFITQILESFREMRMISGGGRVGLLEAVEAPSSAEVAALTSTLSTQVGSQVHLTFRKNTDLLGGLRLVLNGVTYDGSVRGQLERFRGEFLRNIG